MTKTQLHHNKFLAVFLEGSESNRKRDVKMHEGLDSQV